MLNRIATVFVAGLLAGGVGACGGSLALDPDATRPPEVASLSPIAIPAWVGTGPTPFDGHWEGSLVNDAVPSNCSIDKPNNIRLYFDIANGILRRVNYRSERAGADGYVNKHGVFIANTEGRFVLGDLFIGTISGDRMTGQWRDNITICYGSIDLVRSTGDRRYCLDRLSGKAYASAQECNGVDRLLTGDEYRAMGPVPAVN